MDDALSACTARSIFHPEMHLEGRSDVAHTLSMRAGKTALLSEIWQVAFQNRNNNTFQLSKKVLCLRGLQALRMRWHTRPRMQCYENVERIVLIAGVSVDPLVDDIDAVFQYSCVVFFFSFFVHDRAMYPIAGPVVPQDLETLQIDKIIMGVVLYRAISMVPARHAYVADRILVAPNLCCESFDSFALVFYVAVEA